MLRKFAICLIAALCGTGTLLAAGGQSTPDVKFKVVTPLAVPGLTLQPGAYTIHVVDHLHDRFIVKVAGQREHATFIGIPAPQLKQTASSGMATWPNASGSTAYVRGWQFAGLPSALEFVYPKADAVAIAKANNARVAAADPESEGRGQLSGLSQDDLELVTLWLLTPTHVGAGDASGGIQAQKYQEVASLHKPVIAKLPHTASDMPWLWLLCAASLSGAMALRLTRQGSR